MCKQEVDVQLAKWIVGKLKTAALRSLALVVSVWPGDKMDEGSY